MRLFTGCSLVFLFFLISVGGMAQNADSLKAFINKNSVAIKSVQKNSMKDPSIITAADFKELLKLQLISVKAFGTDKTMSAAAAYKVRQKSLALISVYAPASTSFYSISEWQTQTFGAATLSDRAGKIISNSETKSLNDINVKDPALFNAFKIIVQ